MWVVCKPMWVSEACQLFLVPSQSSNTLFYPSKCCELRNVPRLLPFLLSSTWIHIWVFRGVGNASHYVSSFKKTIKNGDLKGMKSHDYHILMQEILPLCMQHFMTKGYCEASFCPSTPNSMRWLYLKVHTLPVKGKSSNVFLEVKLHL